MKTNTLVLLGLLGASLAGCDVRCLSNGPTPAAGPATTGGKVNMNPAGYQGTDAGEPGKSPAAPKSL